MREIPDVELSELSGVVHRRWEKGSAPGASLERLVDTLRDRLKLENVAWNCRSGECGTCVVRLVERSFALVSC